MAKKLTTEEFKIKAIAKHGATYNYVNSVYIKSDIELEIICYTHGSFWQTPETHLSGRGCRLCGIERTANAKRRSPEYFFSESKKKHNNFYSYEESVFVDMSTIIKITCPYHGHFWQTPNEHLTNGKGCKDCGHIKTGLKRRRPAEDFINAVKTSPRYGQIYGVDKVVYTTMAAKVKLHCEYHGYFPISPGKFIAGRGCAKCSDIHSGLLRRRDEKEFFDAVATSPRYGKIYGTDKAIYTTRKAKVKLHCEDHGYFPISPEKFLSGQGCKKCSNENAGLLRRKDSKEFFDAVATSPRYGKIYGIDRAIYTHTKAKVILHCDEHEYFKISPIKFLAGQGCIKCSKSQVSQLELELNNFIKMSGFDIKENHKIPGKSYKYDCLIDDLKIAVEFNGVVFHSQENFFKPVDKDYHVKKRLHAESNGFRMITVWEDEWNRDKDTVKSKLLEIFEGKETIKTGDSLKIDLDWEYLDAYLANGYELVSMEPEFQKRDKYTVYQSGAAIIRKINILEEAA